VTARPRPAPTPRAAAVGDRASLQAGALPRAGRFLQDTGPVIVMVLDQHARVVDVSGSISGVLGWSPRTCSVPRAWTWFIPLTAARCTTCGPP